MLLPLARQAALVRQYNTRAHLGWSEEVMSLGLSARHEDAGTLPLLDKEGPRKAEAWATTTAPSSTSRGVISSVI
jgi:hypothetical protein